MGEPQVAIYGVTKLPGRAQKVLDPVTTNRWRYFTDRTSSHPFHWNDACPSIILLMCRTVLTDTLLVMIPGKAASDPDRDAYNYDEYYDDEYDDGDEEYNSDHMGASEEAIKKENLPHFVTQGSTITVDEGQTIRLPCFVDNLPSKETATAKFCFFSGERGRRRGKFHSPSQFCS